MKNKKVTPKKKHTLLKGEGVNQHTLYGDFIVDETQTDFAEVEVRKDTTCTIV